MSAQHSLWQGEDHLLLVERHFYQERYRKFPYRDIEACIVTKTQTQKLYTIFFGGALFLFSLIAFIYSHQAWVLYSFGTGALLSALLLATNVILGPSCHLAIQTMVQCTRVRCVSRARSAEKLIKKIAPLIEGVQGVLDRDTLREVGTQTAAARTTTTGGSSTSGTTATRPARVMPPVNRKRQNNYGGKWHKRLAIAFALSGLSSLLHFVMQNRMEFLVELIIGALLSFSLLAALINQGRSRLPHNLKTVTWWSLGFTVATWINGYCLGFYLVIVVLKNGGRAPGGNPLWMVDSINSVSPFENMYVMITYSASGALSLLFSVMIYTLYTRYDAQRRTPPPMPGGQGA
jgi:uncharacterized integral membrane protein